MPKAEREPPEQRAVDDLRKISVPAQGRLDPTAATRDLAASIAECLKAWSSASVAGLDAVAANLKPGAVPGSGGSFVAAFAEGNARYLEELAAAARRSAEDMRANARAGSEPQEIDYERLATLVAEKLRSHGVQ